MYIYNTYIYIYANIHNNTIVPSHPYNKNLGEPHLCPQTTSTAKNVLSCTCWFRVFVGVPPGPIFPYASGCFTREKTLDRHVQRAILSQGERGTTEWQGSTCWKVVSIDFFSSKLVTP